MDLWLEVKPTVRFGQATVDEYYILFVDTNSGTLATLGNEPVIFRGTNFDRMDPM